MEHPSQYIPAAMWYNYSSYNDLLNRPRQLENVAPPPQPRPAPMIPQPRPAHLVPQPYHSPVPDVALQMTAGPPKIKKLRKRENWEGKERNFHCNQCDSSFHTQYKLNTHMRIHTGIRPYVCDECGRSFIQGSNLKAHKRIHTGERPFACEECGKTFKASSHLVGHKRLHTGEKPYICGYCNEAFYTSTLLQMHVRKHTGEKPYQCDYCGEAFQQTLELRIHKRVHTGERPYKCWECNSAFISDKELTAHRKAHHKDSKPFRCEVCFKKFRRPTFVIKHQSKCLGPAGSFPYGCEKCGKKFRTQTFCAKHQFRCKGPKTKKRIGRPPKYPRAEGEDPSKRRSRGKGIRKRNAKPIAPTDRISRSRTSSIKKEAEAAIKEEPSESTDEKRGGIDINELVNELGIEGFSKEDLNEIPKEVIQTVPKENITQEFLKDLLVKKEQQRNTFENISSSQEVNGHEEQQLRIVPENLHQQTIPSEQQMMSPLHQPYLHQQQLIPDHQVHQQTISAHQQIMPAHQQVITSNQQMIPMTQSIPLNQAPPPPLLVSDHQSVITPAAHLTYESPQPYVVDLSGNPNNAYYSRQ